MKKRRIVNLTYETIGQLLGLEDGEQVIDVISSSRERCSDIILVKIANGTRFTVPEGCEIPQENKETV